MDFFRKEHGAEGQSLGLTVRRMPPGAGFQNVEDIFHRPIPKFRSCTRIGIKRLSELYSGLLILTQGGQCTESIKVQNRCIRCDFQTVLGIGYDALVLIHSNQGFKASPVEFNILWIFRGCQFDGAVVIFYCFLIISQSLQSIRTKRVTQWIPRARIDHKQGIFVQLSVFPGCLIRQCP